MLLAPALLRAEEQGGRSLRLIAEYAGAEVVSDRWVVKCMGDWCRNGPRQVDFFVHGFPFANMESVGATAGWDLMGCDVIAAHCVG